MFLGPVWIETENCFWKPNLGFKHILPNTPKTQIRYLTPNKLFFSPKTSVVGKAPHFYLSDSKKVTKTLNYKFTLFSFLFTELHLPSPSLPFVELHLISRSDISLTPRNFRSLSFTYPKLKHEKPSR